MGKNATPLLRLPL